MNKELTDAVRILLYGNGDLYTDINSVRKALAKVDGFEPEGEDRLNLLNDACQEAEDVLFEQDHTDTNTYKWLSGSDWQNNPIVCLRHR